MTDDGGESGPVSFALIPCGRCGIGITVSDPEIIEALRVRPVSMFHDECNADQIVLHTYAVTITVRQPNDEDLDEVLVDLVATVEARSFVAAVPLLEKRLADLWTKVVEAAPIVDNVAPARPDPPQPDPPRLHLM